MSKLDDAAQKLREALREKERTEAELASCKARCADAEQRAKDAYASAGKARIEVEALAEGRRR